MCRAQNNIQLNMKMQISSPDSQTSVINYSGSADDKIDGYYYIPWYDDFTTFEFNTGLQKGGFSMLNSEVFGSAVDFLMNKWVENKFPIEDLEVMTNGFNIKKALSFRIQPIIVDRNSGTLNIFFKAAVYNFDLQDMRDFNYDCNIKLFYKQLKIPFGDLSPVKFLNDEFPGYNFEIEFAKPGSNDDVLVLDYSGSMMEELVKSANESKLNDVDISFSIELLRRKANSISPVFEFYSRHKELYLKSINALSDSYGIEKVSLPVNVYHAHLNFPFYIYDFTKANRYKNYKSKENIFQSDYDVLIVPIDIKGDSLTADLFLNYTKLNLNDEISRWTPIKKRVTIHTKYGGSIELPKENWSANFSRGGEQYDIYGYSDYEKYVNEILYIKINDIKDIHRSEK